MILGVGIDRVDLEEFSRMPERGGNNTSKHVYTPWKKISYCRAQPRPLQHFAALAGSGLPSGMVFQVQVTIYPRKSRNI